jgi:hypothetical protein
MESDFYDYGKYCKEVTEKEFRKLILALDEDMVLSAEFADVDTEGHQSKGDILQSLADYQKDIENREVLIGHNPSYDIPAKEKKIFRNGSEFFNTIRDQDGIPNPYEEEYPDDYAAD